MSFMDGTKMKIADGIDFDSPHSHAVRVSVVSDIAGEDLKLQHFSI